MNKVAFLGGFLALVGAVFGVLLLVVPEFVEVFLVIDGKATDCTIGYLGVYEAGFDAESCLDAQTLVASNLDSIPTQKGVDTTSFPLLFPYTTDFIRTIHPLYELTVAAIGEATTQALFFPSSEGKTCQEYYDALQPRQQNLWDNTRGTDANGNPRQDVNAAIGGAASALLSLAVQPVLQSLYSKDISIGGFSPLLAGLYSGADGAFDNVGLSPALGSNANTSVWQLPNAPVCEATVAGIQGALTVPFPTGLAGLPVSTLISKTVSKMNATCCQSPAIGTLIPTMEVCLQAIYGIAGGSLLFPNDGATEGLNYSMSGVCETVGVDSPCTIGEIADAAVPLVEFYDSSAATTESALLENAWKVVDAVLKHGGDAVAVSGTPVGAGGATLYAALLGQEAACAAFGNSAAACPYESQSLVGGQKNLLCSVLKGTGGAGLIGSQYIPSGSAQTGCSFLDLVLPVESTGSSLLNEVIKLGSNSSDSIVQIGGLFGLCTQATPAANWGTCWEYFNFYIIDATYSFGLTNKPYQEGGVDGGYAAAVAACEDDVKDAAAIESAQSLGPAGVAIVGVAGLAGIGAAVVGKPAFSVITGIVSIAGGVVLLAALLVVYNAPVYAAVGGDAADKEDFTPLYQSGSSLTYGLVAIGLSVVGGIILVVSPKCGGGADEKDLKTLGAPAEKSISL